MNDKQKRVVIGAAVAVAVALLFPPFHARMPNGVVRNLGYGFLLDPPHYVTYSIDIVGSVTVEMLLMEWVAIAIVAGVLWWLFKDVPPQ